MPIKSWCSMAARLLARGDTKNCCKAFLCIANSARAWPWATFRRKMSWNRLTRRPLSAWRRACQVISRGVMQTKLLEILCCPYCGGDFSLDEGLALLRRDDEIINGLLHCEC